MGDLHKPHRDNLADALGASVVVPPEQMAAALYEARQEIGRLRQRESDLLALIERAHRIFVERVDPEPTVLVRDMREVLGDG